MGVILSLLPQMRLTGRSPSFFETQVKAQILRPHLRHNGTSENGLASTLDQFPGYLR